MYVRVFADDGQYSQNSNTSFLIWGRKLAWPFEGYDFNEARRMWRVGGGIRRSLKLNGCVPVEKEFSNSLSEATSASFWTTDFVKHLLKNTRPKNQKYLKSSFSNLYIIF